MVHSKEERKHRTFMTFFQSLSLASTYNKLNNLPHLSEDDIDYRDKLYGVYSFEALKYTKQQHKQTSIRFKNTMVKIHKKQREISYFQT